ncbi:HK97 gp10 family phage protein, partial [Xanthomonas citri pv. citri]|nr:HK97 gp10 family phage protein [Xanthomonas citri pv. citri]
MKIRGLDQFIQSLDRASRGGLKRKYEQWLESMGFEFLDIIQDEIIRTKTVDTRRL